MKFLIALLFLSLIFLSTCSTFQSDQRGARGKNEDAPIPNEAMARHSKVSLEELGVGYGVYMRKCGECHVHLLPDEIASEQWHVVVPQMAWNSGISDDEEQSLLKYLKAATKSPAASSGTHPAPVNSL